MKKACFWLIFLSFLLWLAIPTAQVAMKTHAGIRCQENIRYIEDGKKRYIESLSFTDKTGKLTLPENPSRYIEIIPYMPLKNITKCPSDPPCEYSV